MTALLALFHAATGLVNTYPVKSLNLNGAAAPTFFEAVYSDTIGALDANAGYGVATSDGGFVLVGAGFEKEPFVHKSAFAVKVSSTGSLLWTWVSTNVNANDAAIGCTQIAGGGDILVVGYRDEGGVFKRSLTRLNLTTGSEAWTATGFGDAAGAHGGWENIDVTADGGAVLLSGWMAKPDTSEMGYRSGGNTAGGKAVVMQIPVSALSSAPTSADAAWTTTFPAHNAAHAARGLASGEVAVLLWSETDPEAAQNAVSGSAGVAKLSASGTTVWGSINYGGTHKIEGTDLQVSKDGSQLVFVGHGKCSAMATALCGKVVGVTAKAGAVAWTSEFSSCGVPNQCGTTLILNECWGLQSLSDGYAIACGTGIEDCNGLSGQTLTDCNAGTADKRAGAYARDKSVWQAMTVKVGLSGTLQWQRTDAYRRPGEPGVGESGFLNPQTSSAAEYVMLASDGGIVVTSDETDGIAVLRLAAQIPPAPPSVPSPPTPPSPSPPPPAYPPFSPLTEGLSIVQKRSNVIYFSFTLAATMDMLTDSAKAYLRMELTTLYKCREPTCYLRISYEPGSVQVKSSMTIPTVPTSGALVPGGTLPGAVTAEVEAAVRRFAALPLSVMATELNLGVDLTDKGNVTKSTNVMAPIAMIPLASLVPNTIQAQSVTGSTKGGAGESSALVGGILGGVVLALIVLGALVYLLAMKKHTQNTAEVKVTKTAAIKAELADVSAKADDHITTSRDVEVTVVAEELAE